MASIGLLLIRFVFGLTFAGHGAQKLFGWFGGHGLKGTAGWMESIGLKPGKAMALAAGASELAGGILFAIGLWTPLAALLMVVPMIVAIAKVHGPNGYWVTQNGYEYNLAIIAVAIGVALTGPGQYSLDAIIFG
ncbi:DoxX family protein [Parageobacillus thermoglucosidasius]|uniref:Oxidoreductase n=1 Tax=Parageobacillus thermoglucosidasius TaxID=1426 RepID=A0AAN1D585_PARTM|nr:DoxX family protein [Parageobacillus thermoglucosidasius]ALF08729.1 oxidoreductase [Parageobacillus thermoglucosidasius]ANZ28813.1 oxidoreductase [Parageobacillus thermoglucosidasius]APM79550.1 oxidoreductase [Parageobacillus thermoglucosidasius]KJX68338.1 oxidoreductase [Parageobacillus thermoglucosidasius]MBY6268778.1 DoxX family protein [Parageobacillus thermoglucosidasius]